MTNLEVIALSLDDAIAAAQGGAHSVEVCVDLAAEGLTPPLDMVKAIRDAVQIEMNVMLRPHNQGHVYDEADIDLMLEQIDHFKPLGIQTIVFGAHQVDGTLHVELIKRMAAAAQPVALTVHRALEWSSNPDTSLRALIGVPQRILTSGPADSALEGQAGLRAWVDEFGAYYRFAAAGGIRLTNIKAIAVNTGVAECHVGTAAQIDGKVDAGKVRELVAALA